MDNATIERRSLLRGLAALGGASALGGLQPAMAAPASQVRFRFAASAISWDTNIEEAIAVTSRLGLPGLEPFRQNIINYLDKPLVLRKMFDDAGVAMVTCSNGGRGFSQNFFDPAQIAKTISDHVAFARDFIKPFGTCGHFKLNLGNRPPSGDTSDEQIKIAADALNQIGRQTIELGMRLAPHPHVSSLIETDHELRTLMSLTDPRYVWLTADTAHLQLGGMDPYRIISEYWPRIGAIHYKDSSPRTRGATTLQVPKTGPEAGGHGHFRNLGGKDSGGVDFPRIQKFLIEKKYNGWVTLDLDASMIEGKDMEETLKINIKYLVDVLGVDPATV